MESFIIHVPDSKAAKAVKALLDAVGGSFEKATEKGVSKKKEKPYNPEFVAKIKQGEKDIAEGRYTIIKVEDLWK